MGRFKRNLLLLISGFILLISLVGCKNESTSYEKEDIEIGSGFGGMLDDIVPLSVSPILSTMLKTTASGVKVERNSSAVIDYSNIEDGYFMAAWTGDKSAQIKLQSKGPSETTYTYNLLANGEYEAFPFSDGNGDYTITIYKNVDGTKYATVLSKQVTVTMQDPMASFIRPNQYVNYSEGSLAVQKAAEKCDGITDNLKKVEAIYNYVVATLSYDTVKAQTVKSGYLPDLDKVLTEKKGICFDYAALMVGMLRSQGVPCKLVIGYVGTAYHAWINVWSESEGWVDNMIFFNGNDWKLMDPTFASSGNKSQSIMKYIGDGQNYQAKYLY